MAEVKNIATLAGLIGALKALKKGGDEPVFVNPENGTLNVGTTAFKVKTVMPTVYTNAISELMEDTGLDPGKFPRIEEFCAGNRRALEPCASCDDGMSWEDLWEAMVEHMTDGKIAAADVMKLTNDQAEGQNKLREALEPFAKDD